MAALRELDSAIEFHLFTRVPAWLFAQSLDDRAFTHHDVLTDVGLAQLTSLYEDLDETVRRLDELLPFRPSLLRSLARQVVESGCELVVCDVAALGIAVAREAGLPSVLVENFTWDWIYEGYVASEPRLQRFIDLLRGVYSQVDHHVQTEPVCSRTETALAVPPVSREPRVAPDEVRSGLVVPPSARLVLITMGGVEHAFEFVPRLAGWPDTFFVMPTTGDTRHLSHNVLALAQTSGLYHPDLVRACDAVVGKNGYSTMAEVYAAGVPFGYVVRPGFRESDVIAAYVDTHMPSLGLTAAEFDTGAWLERLPDLLRLPRVASPRPNGATQVAQFIRQLL